MQLRAPFLRALAVCAGLLGASPVVAQALGRGTDPEISIWRVLAGLIFCLLLAGSAAYILKLRFGQGLGMPSRNSARLRLIASIRIAPQSSVCLIALDGHEMLVATSLHGPVVLLPKLPECSDEGLQAQ